MVLAHAGGFVQFEDVQLAGELGLGGFGADCSGFVVDGGFHGDRCLRRRMVEDLRRALARPHRAVLNRGLRYLGLGRASL